MSDTEAQRVRSAIEDALIVANHKALQHDPGPYEPCAIGWEQVARIAHETALDEGMVPAAEWAQLLNDAEIIQRQMKTVEQERKVLRELLHKFVAGGLGIRHINQARALFDMPPLEHTKVRRNQE